MKQLRSRRARWGIGLVLVVLFTAAPAAAAPAACPTQVDGVCDAVEDVIDDIPVVGGVKDAVSGAIDFASDPAGYWADQVAGSIETVSDWMLEEMSRPVLLTSPAVLETFGLTWGIGISLTVLFFITQVMKSVAAGAKPQKMIADGMGHLLLALVATPVLLLLLQLVVTMVDGLSEAMLGSFSADIGQLGASLSTAAVAVSGGSGFLGAFLGFFVLVPMVLVWLLLEARAALLVLGVVFMPLVFAGLSSKDRWETVKKPVGALVSLILLKFVIFTALGLSAAVINSNTVAEDASTGDQARVLVTGIAMLATTVFASAKIAQFIPVFGDDMKSSARERRGMSATSVLMAANMGRGMVRGGGKAAAGGAGALGATAQAKAVPGGGSPKPPPPAGTGGVAGLGASGVGGAVGGAAGGAHPVGAAAQAGVKGAQAAAGAATGAAGAGQAAPTPSAGSGASGGSAGASGGSAGASGSPAAATPGGGGGVPAPTPGGSGGSGGGAKPAAKPVKEPPGGGSSDEVGF